MLRADAKIGRSVLLVLGTESERGAMERLMKMEKSNLKY